MLETIFKIKLFLFEIHNPDNEPTFWGRIVSFAKSFQIVTVAIGLLFLSPPVFSQLTCVDLFSNSRAHQLEVPKKTEIHDLISFGQAMTEGMLLHPEQKDLFEVYRLFFFGDPNTKVDGHKLDSVTNILVKYPELQKQFFPEYTIQLVERVYQTPEALNKFIKTQINTAAQVRNNLFQIESNLDFWKKVLNFKEEPIPENLKSLNLGKQATEEDKSRAHKINKARAEFLAKEKSKFIKSLNRIINQANRLLLADASHNHLIYRQKDKSQFIYAFDTKVKGLSPNKTYVQKAKALFSTLKSVQEGMEINKQQTQAIRQALFDLVFSIGYGNQATVELLKSNNGAEKIEGLNKVWNEANNFAEELGYQGHIQELAQSLKIDFATGLSKNEDFIEVVKKLEREVLQSPFTTRATDVIRVRSLSIQEAPFRSCLGTDCSTRTYFDKALDPNYIYFTMTDSEHRSFGHATLVLGTANDKKTNLIEQVAFLDKLQNIPTQKIEAFLAAVNKSLMEKRYRLAIPTYLGKDIKNHGGLSNMDIITDFVQTNIMPRLTEVKGAFTPHEHQYDFKNAFSRADQSLEVRVFNENILPQTTEIKRGEWRQEYFADKHLNKGQFLNSFLKLKDSEKEGDLMKFIKSVSVIDFLDKMKIYRKTDFYHALKQIVENKNAAFLVRKAAFFELLLSDFDFDFYIKNEAEFSSSERVQINAELKQWKNSSDKRKQNLFSLLQYYVIEAMENKNLEFVNRVVELPFYDVNAGDGNGYTALHHAVERNDKGMVELLLKIADIDVNAKKNRNGYTALHRAVDLGHTDMVELLLKTPRVDANAVDTDGGTALHHAESRGYLHIVNLLKAYGARE